MLRFLGTSLLALAVAAGAGAAARAERGPENPDVHIVLLPESARATWNWLSAATTANDPFFGGWRGPSPSANVVVVRAGGRLPDGAFVRRWRERRPASTFAFTVGGDTWSALADRARRVVLYTEGCCSFERVVVARYRRPPPARAAGARLDDAILGFPVRLGEPAADVVRRLGAPPERRTAGARTAVRYPVWWRDARYPSTCLDDRTIVFERGRVVAYEVWYGC